MSGLERAHFENARGSTEQCVAYCDGSLVDDVGRKMLNGVQHGVHILGPFSFGVAAVPKQGPGQKGVKRMDSLALAVAKGASDKELFEEFPGLVLQYGARFNVVRNTTFTKRMAMPSVFLFVGKTGTGKTRTAFEIASFIANGYDNVFKVSCPKGSGLYWDGYRQQPVVLIDDFDGNVMTPSTMKQLLDRYPMTVPVHGSADVQFNSPVIFITSQFAPKYWWAKKAGSSADADAINRRVSWRLFFRSPSPKAVAASAAFVRFKAHAAEAYAVAHSWNLVGSYSEKFDHF